MRLQKYVKASSFDFLFFVNADALTLSAVYYTTLNVILVPIFFFIYFFLELCRVDVVFISRY